MKLAIVAVGHRQPDWISAGCSEYLKRLPPEMAARMIEIKPEPRGSKSREQLLAAERSQDLEQLSGFIADGRLTPCLERTFPLEQAAAAMRHLESGNVRGKVAITP